MNVTFAYLGRSQLRSEGSSRVLMLQPNLSREAVHFSADLKNPLRFREALSALHDVVINDLRYKPRDKTAYLEWKEGQKDRLAAIRREEYQRVKEELAQQRDTALTPDLEKQYSKAVKRYWEARDGYTKYLLKNDPAMWRTLMPCDPVITVAQDAVFFECFSADESSYGCLTVDREGGFGACGGMAAGTTNVDYSWELYNQFQRLRTYRQTRFLVDPESFSVQTQGRSDYREDKIDLPSGWLRGFMQVQGAMGLPMRRVTLSPAAVYSVLAFLKRHRSQKSPRAIRFELLDGQSPRLVLEPWEQPVVSHETRYAGPGGEPIRIWGRQRLLVLARLLPLIERVDVYLLGTGMPSFWVAKMGDMRLTLGLSGWTANDWTRGSALDLLSPPAEPGPMQIEAVAGLLQRQRAMSFEQIVPKMACSRGVVAAALRHLAHAGQAIFDLDAGVFRWRQIMPMALGEAQMGPPNEELTASRELALRRKVVVDSRRELEGGAVLLEGKVEGKPVEMLVDADGLIRRGKCVCSHHFKSGLRAGPCRHLLAMRQAAQGATQAPSSDDGWFDRLERWVRN